MSAPLIEVKNLQRYFGAAAKPVRAVDDVSFSIQPGETLGLVGESGSGKSTIGRTLLRLIDATSGQVLYRGEDLGTASSSRMRALRSKLQMIFQDPYASLNPKMRVKDILGEALQVHGLAKGKEAREARIAELLELVGLRAEHASRYPHEFSGGQRQRIAIARAIALEPEFILLDEPTSALDLSVQAQIIDLLRKLQNEKGLSYLFISHDLKVVRALCHRVMVMQHGKIVEQGPVADVLTNPQTEYTARLVRAAFEIAA